MGTLSHMDATQSRNGLLKNPIKSKPYKEWKHEIQQSLQSDIGTHRSLDIHAAKHVFTRAAACLALCLGPPLPDMSFSKDSTSCKDLFFTKNNFFSFSKES